ncbi:MAG: hypothetical protein ACKO7N_09955, partial [Candidatus Nitrosotenuis sp.]
MSTYKILVICAVIAIAVIGIITVLSLSKGVISTQDYSIDVDPLKDPQNLFVTARVMIQNTGGKPLTNIVVNFGNGELLQLGTLTPGQKVILSPPQDNSLEQVVVTADNGISVIKEYRLAPKMVGMMGS